MSRDSELCAIETMLTVSSLVRKKAFRLVSRGFLAKILMVCLSAKLGQAATLASHVSVFDNAGNWSYTVYNDELNGSGNWISTFTITLGAPVMVTGTPNGWDFSTDNFSF